MSERTGDGPGRPDPAEHTPPTSAWEWAVAALGAALVAGAIGYLVHHAVTVGGPRSDWSNILRRGESG